MQALTWSSTGRGEKNLNRISRIRRINGIKINGYEI